MEDWAKKILFPNLFEIIKKENPDLLVPLLDSESVGNTAEFFQAEVIAAGRDTQ